MTNGQYDPETLLKNYQPLVKAVYKKFNTYLDNQEDRKELYGQIEYEFNRLVSEYNPRRGVDFPCYIKRMLNQRVYHYITKSLKVTNKEVTYEEVYDEVPEDGMVDESLDFIEGMECLDDNLVLGKKQRQLMIDILIKKKPLEQIAHEEDVDIKVIRLRLHFLCKKLIEHNKDMEEYFIWRNGGIPDFLKELEDEEPEE